jgi:hypothetical protein
MIRRPGPREFEFVPRIINPVKVKRVVLFAADAELRGSRTGLERSMPWLEVELLQGTPSASRPASDEATLFLCDDTGLALLDEAMVRERNPNAILALLSYHRLVQCSPPQVAGRSHPYTLKADLIFAVNRSDLPPARIIPSVVRAAEDLLNILKYSRVRRFIFHIVDDEPRWFSQFLPVLYGIIGQRADIKITRTYEESLEFIFGARDESEIAATDYLARGHGDDVVCLITDIFFPRGDDLQCAAGRDLIRLMNKFYPRVPVIIASKASEVHELKDLGFALPKGDPGSLEKLKDYILNLTGLGDFLIYDEEGRELRRAKNIHGICQILLEAEKDTGQGRRLREILERYGEEDKFSNWLYMHSYRELGDRLRPRRSRGQQLIRLLKRNLSSEIARIGRTPLPLQGRKVFDLEDLRAAILDSRPDTLQPFSDNDIISSWLDRQGYPELAEELRPIHGSGEGLRRAIVRVIEKWIDLYGRH